MRWDRLFDDLEGQLEHELHAERIDLLAEEERLRLGRLVLRDRLAAMIAGERRTLDLVLRNGTPLRVSVGTTGRDWVAGDVVPGGVRPSCVIPFDSLGGVTPSGDQLARGLDADAPSGPPVDALASRLGMAFVLRDLCRRRTPVDLVCEWGVLHGTIDRVGRDHLDLAEHDAGEPRRAGAVRAVRLVPFSRILWVRF